jgi:hypothetical protein
MGTLSPAGHDTWRVPRFFAFLGRGQPDELRETRAPYCGGGKLVRADGDSLGETGSPLHQ